MSKSEGKDGASGVDAAQKEVAAGQQQGGEEEEPKQLTVDMLEEDDEFEEFENPRWSAGDMEQGGAQQWKDNWDDDSAADDRFIGQLRAELAKQ